MTVAGFLICLIILDNWHDFNIDTDNIIIVTNVIMLEFFSAWYIDPALYS